MLQIRTFKMNYRRIFGLKLSCFVTIDPSSFEVTNTFDYADVIKLKPKDGDTDAFSFTCAKHGAMEWKSEFRAQLLTEFVRLRGLRLDDATLGLPAPFACDRVKRSAQRVRGGLRVRPHALVETAADGTVLAEYRFVQVAAVQAAADDPTVLVLHVAGRARMWAVSPANGGKSTLLASMKEQAALIGLDLKQGPQTSVEQVRCAWRVQSCAFPKAFCLPVLSSLPIWIYPPPQPHIHVQVQLERAKYGTGTGVPLATYNVAKATRRHPGVAVRRKLTVTNEWLVERDAATFKVNKGADLQGKRGRPLQGSKGTKGASLAPFTFFFQFEKPLLCNGPSLSLPLLHFAAPPIWMAACICRPFTFYASRFRVRMFSSSLYYV